MSIEYRIKFLQKWQNKVQIVVFCFFCRKFHIGEKSQKRSNRGYLPMGTRSVRNLKCTKPVWQSGGKGARKATAPKWSDLHGAERFSDRCVQDKIRPMVGRCCTFIDQNQPGSGVKIQQPCSRINCERSACDDQKIGVGDCIGCAGKRFLVEALFIEHDVGLNRSAAGTFWNAGSMQNRFF